MQYEKISLVSGLVLHEAEENIKDKINLQYFYIEELFEINLN